MALVPPDSTNLAAAAADAAKARAAAEGAVAQLDLILRTIQAVRVELEAHGWAIRLKLDEHDTPPPKTPTP